MAFLVRRLIHIKLISGHCKYTTMIDKSLQLYGIRLFANITRMNGTQMVVNGVRVQKITLFALYIPVSKLSTNRRW